MRRQEEDEAHDGRQVAVHHRDLEAVLSIVGIASSLCCRAFVVEREGLHVAVAHVSSQTYVLALYVGIGELILHMQLLQRLQHRRNAPRRQQPSGTRYAIAPFVSLEEVKKIA